MGRQRGRWLERGLQARPAQRQYRSSTHWWGVRGVSVDEKYGCTRAALAEIRRLGSYCKSCCGGRGRGKEPEP